MRLFITFEYFMPAYKAGGPIQSLDNLVKNFRNENVELYICCSDKDLDGTVLDVESDSWTNYNSNTKVYYATESSCERGVVSKLLDEIKPHVLFINGIFSKHFSITPLLWKGDTKKILSVRGMLHAGALSQKRFKKKAFLLLFKLRNWHRKSDFHATTEEEAQFIKDAFGDDVKVWVVPNFPKTIGYQAPIGKQPGSLRLLSIALISPMKNIKLLIEALAQCKGDINYDIYGPVKDEQYWAECKTVIATLPSNIKVAYKGAVTPDKVEGVLSSYHVMAQPSKSENFGHSIFEAFSAGKPVITSRFTPWNELQENRAGYNVDIDNTASLKNSIEAMVAFDNDTYASWTEHAYAYAMHKVNVPEIKAGYKTMFGIA